jgi:hypothetical protein
MPPKALIFHVAGGIIKSLKNSLIGLHSGVKTSRIRRLWLNHYPIQSN